jgi:hypothetical protein
LWPWRQGRTTQRTHDLALLEVGEAGVRLSDYGEAVVPHLVVGGGEERGAGVVPGAVAAAVPGAVAALPGTVAAALPGAVAAALPGAVVALLPGAVAALLSGTVARLRASATLRERRAEKNAEFPARFQERRTKKEISRRYPGRGRGNFDT